jgi:hypothetical protein
MKTILKYTAGLTGVLLSGMLLVSCTKTFDSKVSATYNNGNSSNVQLYVATVGATRNYLYVDYKPVNGALLTFGSLFPGTGFGFNVPTGMRSFLLRDTLTTSTQPQLSFAQNMEIGKSYTVFAYDTITTVAQKTVETPIVIPSDSSARIRFANFVYNPGMLTGFDLYSKKRQQNIFTNLLVTDVSSFIPYASNSTDTFYIRPTGTTTNLQNFNPSPAPGSWNDISVVLTPTPKRSYTIVFRGGYRATTTTNTTVRNLTAFANY